MPRQPLDYASPSAPKRYPRDTRDEARKAIVGFFLTAAMGFRAHPLGGFGGMIPEPSAG